jgi:hypothetical protein
MDKRSSLRAGAGSGGWHTHLTPVRGKKEV